jgi:hypothetical protein
MSKIGTARERHLAQSLSGRASGSGRLGLSNVLFRPITLICLVLIGFFAFGALIVLGGFAKDLRKAPPGQATPRSVSAVGYQAMTDYLKRLNYDVEETRANRSYYERDSRLVIYTPSRPTRRLNRTLDAEKNETRLVVLPKWSVGQMQPQRGEESKTGWARKTSEKGLYYSASYKDMVEDMPVLRRHTAPSPDAQVFFQTPFQRHIPASYSPDFEDLQYFDLTARWDGYLDELREQRRREAEERRRKRAEERGETYEPKETKSDKEKDAEKESESSEKDSGKKAEKEEKTPEPLPNPEIILKIDGRVVLIRMEDTQTYILSEPDLINTMAFKTQGGAMLANAILADIIRNQDLESYAVDFDVSLHGIEANRNIIKLMVTPPFLAATLCLLAAGGLVAWQGFNRFGDPARVRPDYAQGPVSLARTAAEFMGIANRAHHTGEDYASLIRRQVAAELGYKDRATQHIDTLLDAREKRLKIQPPFADLKRSISTADNQSYGHYARALTTWRNAMTETDLQTTPAPHSSSPDS